MTNTHLESAGASSRTPGDTHRQYRQNLNDLRLRKQIRDLVQAYTSATYLGENPVVEDYATDLGFASRDLCIVDLRLEGRRATLIVYPHQGRRRDEIMQRLMDLRQRTRRNGQHAILVPQGVIERQPRLGNASLLGVVATRIKVDATARMVVLEHLVQNGNCTLSELAGLIRHRDPFGAILHLAAVGALTIDLKRAISPATMMGLPGPRFPANRAAS